MTSLGIPTDTEYMEEYCRRAGIPPVHNWNFYMAFSFFRVAAILQGVYKRAIEGKPLFFGMNLSTIENNVVYEQTEFKIRL